MNLVTWDNGWQFNIDQLFCFKVTTRDDEMYQECNILLSLPYLQDNCSQNICLQQIVGYFANIMLKQY